MSRIENIIFSLLVFVASSYGFYYSYRQITPTELPMHPMRLPSIVLILIAILSLVRLGIAIHSPKKNEPTFIALKISKKNLATIILICLYVTFCRSAGFLLSTFLYLVSQMLVLCPKKNKKYWLIVCVSGIFSVGVYLLFTRALDVVLPTGVLDFL
ncbi:MAG: tripartite tricarboxylate transporter TctB family protein [Pyramidobacter sp.]|jgi:putative tricarboxylic transport membrane protein